MTDVVTSSAPGRFACVGSRRLLRCRELLQLESTGELVDAGCEALEAGFEPVERGVRLVHDSSFGPPAHARIRGSNDSIV